MSALQPGTWVLVTGGPCRSGRGRQPKRTWLTRPAIG